MNVVIERFEIVSEGTFSSDYALYYIKTPALSFNVTRRYTDFFWLYNILKKSYPGTFVPPIPKKTIMKEMNE